MLSRVSSRLRRSSSALPVSAYFSQQPIGRGGHWSLTATHVSPLQQRSFSVVTSLLQDSFLVDVGVIGLVGTSAYFYWQLSQARELLQSSRRDLQQEQVLHNNLRAELEKLQRLYSTRSDDLSRTAQELKMTKELQEIAQKNADTVKVALDQEIQRLKSLVELQKTSDLGQMGEGTLKGLLEKAQQDQLIASFDLQPTIGKLRPDAVATLKNGRTLVIDSKAFDKQNFDGSDTARLNFTRNLKSKMTDLQKKAYPSLVPQSYNTVWMLLPHDRDLQRAYHENDVLVDDHGLHQHAHKQKIQLVGPESFLSSLRTLQLLHDEHDQQETQEAADPRTLWGPLFTELIQHYRKTENTHKKLIAEHNLYVAKLEEYYEQGREVLDTKKLPKGKKPKGLELLKGLPELPALVAAEMAD